MFLNKEINISLSLLDIIESVQIVKGCFYHKFPTLFVSKEEDKETLNKTLTMSDDDYDSHSLCWVKSSLEQVLLCKLFIANNYEAVKLFDKAYDPDLEEGEDEHDPYVVLVNIPPEKLVSVLNNIEKDRKE